MPDTPIRCGGCEAHYTAAEPQGWLNVTPVGGTHTTRCCSRDCVRRWACNQMGEPLIDVRRRPDYLPGAVLGAW